ncbi:MAG: acetyl-CoA carboxylase, biotin carboxyl carrier protein [Gemmatimonadetes bacterium 13_2_20CM_69_8]|nr:MAG: acetyl-CoA carboxylase, biotin carboxyl carrier protein [Gemmatimonadetes bacterium 13_2_20CM_69_8]
MNLDIIARLVRILSESPELGAIEVRRGGGGGGGGEQQVAVAQAPAPPLGAGAPGSPAAPGAPPKTQLVEIKSPMVGTFYSAPEPGAPPYVKGGSRVAAGQVVCIIEAMKIMNEIEAEVSGLVREVCVENAQPVEFGQPLFRVDPHA